MSSHHSRLEIIINQFSFLFHSASNKQLLYIHTAPYSSCSYCCCCCLSQSLSALLRAIPKTTNTAAGVLVVNKKVGVVHHQTLVDFGGKGFEMPRRLFVCWLILKIIKRVIAMV